MVRIGELDDDHHPRLLNPYPLNDGTLGFETSGVLEPYPGVHVVYRLTEPGIYEYRYYLTAPLPDPDQPLTADSEIPFRRQLKFDYNNSQAGRMTPAAI